MKRLNLFGTLLFVLIICGSAWAANPVVTLDSAKYDDDSSAIDNVEAITPYRKTTFTHSVTADTPSISYVVDARTDRGNYSNQGSITAVGGALPPITVPWEFSSEEQGYIRVTVTDGNNAQGTLLTIVKAQQGEKPPVSLTGIDLVDMSSPLNVPANNISISLDKDLGSWKRIKVSFNPSDATNKKIEWTVADQGIVTWTLPGADTSEINVAASGLGSTVITATAEDGGFTATCNVTVTGRGSETERSLELYPDSVILKVGEYESIKATPVPYSSTSGEHIRWIIDNPDIAKTRAYGAEGETDHFEIDALKPGTATITAELMSAAGEVLATATCPLTISGEASSISIDLSGLGLVDGYILPLEPGEYFSATITSNPAGAVFSATDLPDGLTLTPGGLLSGIVNEEVHKNVLITATFSSSVSTSSLIVVEVGKSGSVVDDGGGSGGGCNAGFAGLAALVFLSLWNKQRSR